MFVMLGNSFAQPTQIYHHPTLDIQFEAPPNWMQIPHPEDQTLYELVSPDTTIHIVVFHRVTSQDGPTYVKNIALLKQLKVKGEPVKKIIKNKEAFEVEASGLIKQKPIRMIITALPFEKGFFIIQMWSPEPSFMNYQQMMRNIQGSLGITG
jgi:hypothetical protein